MRLAVPNELFPKRSVWKSASYLKSALTPMSASFALTWAMIEPVKYRETEIILFFDGQYKFCHGTAPPKTPRAGQTFAVTISFRQLLVVAPFVYKRTQRNISNYHTTGTECMGDAI